MVPKICAKNKDLKIATIALQPDENFTFFAVFDDFPYHVDTVALGRV